MIQYLVGVMVLIYTAILVIVGRYGRKKAKNKNFLTGGREFNTTQVFFMISALWCSWVYIVELETAWLFGISAIWFGIAVAIMAIASVFALGTPLSKLSFVTNSGIIGDKFGSLARILSAIVIGLTFPVFAMSNAVMAAGFARMLYGSGMLITLAIICVIVLLYVFFGGIWSLAYTQIINFCVMGIGMLIFTFLSMTSISADTLDKLPIRYTRWDGIGVGIILAYIVVDLLNVVSAQAEFQIILAAKNIQIGRRGTYLSSICILVFAICSAIIGLCARGALGAADKTIGILAVPEFLLTKIGHQPFLAAIAMLSIWAAALTWTAPLMFSGASSLGNDVLKHCFNKMKHGDSLTKTCVQIFLPLQAILIMIYGLSKPEQLAWWQVFGLTVRNGAIFAPTIALLFWSVAKKESAIISMIVGVGLGIGWNWLGDFSANIFFLGINPMWISASASLLFLTILAPIFQWKSIGFTNSLTNVTYLILSFLTYLCTVLLYLSISTRPFAGLTLLVATVFLSVYAYRAIRLTNSVDDVSQPMPA